MTTKTDLKWKMDTLEKNARSIIPLNDVLKITNRVEEYNRIKKAYEESSNIYVRKRFDVDDLLDAAYQSAEDMNEWRWDDYETKEKIVLINKLIRKLKVVRFLYRRDKE